MWRRTNRDTATFVALWAERPTRRTEALMSAPAALAHAIDFERYPIDDLDGPAARTLVARCREQLGCLGACELEGFLRAEAVSDAVRSVQGRQSLAFRTETTHNLEFSGREAELDADDPLRIQVRSAKALLAYDQIPGDSPLRAVYESDVLTRFVGAALASSRSTARRTRSARSTSCSTARATSSAGTSTTPTSS
jgi:hypothetical protein